MATTLRPQRHVEAITGLRHGDRIRIDHADLPEEAKATGTYIAHSGGTTAMIALDGTGAYAHIPRHWIKRGDPT